MALGTKEELRDQILQALVDRAFLATVADSTRRRLERIDEGRQRLGLVAGEMP